jgi:hypothetical protein
LLAAPAQTSREGGRVLTYNITCHDDEGRQRENILGFQLDFQQGIKVGGTYHNPGDFQISADGSKHDEKQKLLLASMMKRRNFVVGLPITTETPLRAPLRALFKM